jgi:AraC-like DNA-binding protein
MPSSAVRTFTDSDAYFAGIRNLQITGLITQRGEFHAESTRIDLHRLWMHRFSEKLPRIMRVTPSGMRAVILFPICPAQSAMQVNGSEVSQSQIARFGLSSEWYLRSSAASGWATMSLPPQGMAAAGEAIIARELAPPSVPHCTTPPAPALSRLRRLHEAAGHLAQTAPEVLAKPEVARAMEEGLVEAMVLCLAEDRSDGLPNIQRHRMRVMRRLEEALGAKPKEPLYMTELCATIGASYWTLRACCLEYLGMSPKRYLWLRRMNLARRALQRADAKRTTVTEIATDYGFWELGRFSIAYRTLFGEMPSITLRRAA